MHVHELQKRIVETGSEVWGVENATNPRERLLRMAEEFIELLCAAGLSWSTLCQITTREYFDKQKGEVPQEVAGAAATLLSFANSIGIDVESVVLAEVQRVLLNKEAACAKHAAKPDSMRVA